MKKQGRPKNITTRNGRRHSLMLSEKAEFYWRQLKKGRSSFDFSRYVSEHIIRDFEINPEGYMKFELGNVNTEIMHLQNAANVIVKRMEILREKRISNSIPL